MSDESQANTQQTLQGGHAPTQHQHGMAAVFLALMGTKPFEGGEVAAGITRILSGYSSAYLIQTDEDGHEFCLIDCGADSEAEEIMAVLRYKGVDATAVKAIFLTHGHPDHSAGLRKFPDAEVYVGPGDHDFVEGTGAADGPILRLVGKKPELAIADDSKLHNLYDGEITTVGNKQIRAFSVPGHTRGSFAYLIGDQLFIGDATTFDKQDKAMKPPVPVSYSVSEELESLAHLIKRFDDENIVVETVIPSHSGAGSLQAVRELVSVTNS